MSDLLSPNPKLKKISAANIRRMRPHRKVRTMNDKQLGILQHSLGLDQNGRGTMYRNHFVTGEGSRCHADCMALVDAGYMGVQKKHPLAGGDDCFWVTGAGKCAAIENSPAPPKPTRSQQNYRDWLSYGGSLSFIDYLKMKPRRLDPKHNKRVVIEALEEKQ